MKNRLSIALVMALATGLTQAEQEGTITAEQAEKLTALFDKNLYAFLDDKELAVVTPNGNEMKVKFTATDPLFQHVEEHVEWLNHRRAEAEVKGYAE